ncbi:ZN646 protein, partial [Penelope pileata]|nr:ZN646 protein [Penelope pileata]
AAATRPFRCEQCGRSYKHAGSLVNHRQSHATGLFRCPACPKAFGNLMALKNHRRSH